MLGRPFTPGLRMHWALAALIVGYCLATDIRAEETALPSALHNPLGYLEAQLAKPQTALTGREAIPAAAAVAEARALTRKIFAEQFAAATQASQQLALAQELLAQAQRVKNDSTSRYALLLEAQAMATNAAAIDLGLQIGEELIAAYALDPQQVRAYIVRQSLQNARFSTARRAVAAAAVKVAQQAQASSDWNVAGSMLELAENAYRDARDFTASREAQQLREQVETISRQQQRVQQALAALKTNPADAAAKQELGLHLAFDLRQWQAGFGLLKQAAHPKLAELAASSYELPPTAEAQCALAGNWLAAENELPELLRPAMQEWAYGLYTEALPKLTGLVKIQVSLKLKEYEGAVAKNVLKGAGDNPSAVASIAGMNQPEPAAEASPAEKPAEQPRLITARQGRFVLGPDGKKYYPGLVGQLYPRHASQDTPDHSVWVAPEDMGTPLGSAVVIPSVLTYKWKGEANFVAKGYFLIDEPGEHTFCMNTFYDRAGFYIDGKLLCPLRDGETKRQTITLEKGLYPIQIVGMYNARNYCIMQWAGPGKTELGPMPADKVFHSRD